MPSASVTPTVPVAAVSSAMVTLVAPANTVASFTGVTVTATVMVSVTPPEVTW